MVFCYDVATKFLTC